VHRAANKRGNKRDIGQECFGLLRVWDKNATNATLLRASADATRALAPAFMLRRAQGCVSLWRPCPPVIHRMRVRAARARARTHARTHASCIHVRAVQARTHSRPRDSPAFAWKSTRVFYVYDTCDPRLRYCRSPRSLSPIRLKITLAAERIRCASISIRVGGRESSIESITSRQSEEHDRETRPV